MNDLEPRLHPSLLQIGYSLNSEESGTLLKTLGHIAGRSGLGDFSKAPSFLVNGITVYTIEMVLKNDQW